MDFTSLNSKRQGDAGLGLAIGYFASRGWTTSIPLSDSQDYDLIVDMEGELKKVQVKTTRYTNPQDHYTLSLTTKGGNQSWSKVIKKLDKEVIDILFLVAESGDMYMIPTGELRTRSSVTLCSKYDRFLVKF